ncbi:MULTISPECIES: SurA N-terminal domain-containing protein [Enorma]|uniref:hypothetical protein n=1 Tax=Enorma TaxID=1472762 RepID=UPI00034DE4F4|nr:MULTISPECIES: hypothetical protein [Enorma]
MGLLVKRDELEGEHDYIDGIEVIERSDVPDDLPESEVEVIEREDADADPDDGETDADAAGADETGADAASSDGADADDDVAADDEAAEDDDPEDADEDTDEDAAPAAALGPTSSDHGSTQQPNRAILIAVLVIAIIVAGVGGYFIGRGGFGGASSAPGSALLTEGQLDATVASYTYKGARHDITAREAIESQYSLDSMKTDDGMYRAPSAETLVAYVRTQILLNEAEARGIEVTDDEVTAYAEQTYGTSDFATLATQYGLSEDQAREIVRNSTMIEKLYNQIAPASTVALPEEPEQPADGDTSTRSKAYADYIINLAGDEWDAETGTWASTDGPYATALQGMDVTADSASYEEAIIAYYVAYQEYATQASQSSQAWTDFANTLFADADMDIYGLYA